MSSDSSDDENLQKLREAADFQFINDTMFDSNKKPQVEVKLPSLRPQSSEENHSKGTTPEFRHFVAKKLDAYLDSTLIYKNHNTDHYIKPKRRKSGIKLFKSSTKTVKLIKETGTFQKKVQKSELSDDEQKYKNVAVSPDDILSKKETKHWSKRSKAPLYEYRQGKNGQIVLK